MLEWKIVEKSVVPTKKAIYKNITFIVFQSSVDNITEQKYYYSFYSSGIIDGIEYSITTKNKYKSFEEVQETIERFIDKFFGG